MENLNNVVVSKVPNPDMRKKSEDSRHLPQMPRLYLELIENKEKVKQNLVNKEYDPDDAASDISFFSNSAMKQGQSSRRQQALSDVSEEDDDSGSEHSDRIKIMQGPSGDEDSGSESAHSSAASSATSASKPSMRGKSSRASSTTASVSNSDDDEEDEDKDARRVVRRDSDDDQSTIDEEEEDDDDSEGRVDDVAMKRKSAEEIAKSQKYAKILNESLPPKLSELERQGEINTRKSIPNLERIEPTEDEEDELKRELLFKFELLKKSYKVSDIPDFNIHSDLKNMSRSYESTLRRVSLDSCVENYKQLLIGAFMVLEFIMGYLFKFDMQGFTQQQILNMNQYERLLIELGEQSYVPGGSQWPVEVRLLIMVLGNAAIFIIAKMIMKKTGSNLMGMMNSFAQPQMSSASKRKMRGPSINPDDIPDISSADN